MIHEAHRLIPEKLIYNPEVKILSNLNINKFGLSFPASKKLVNYTFKHFFTDK